MKQLRQLHDFFVVDFFPVAFFIRDEKKQLFNVKSCHDTFTMNENKFPFERNV